MPGEHDPPFQLIFGRFMVDLGGRLLFLDGKLVPIATKTFDTLEVFLRHPGQVLDRETLIRAVWPGTFVDDNNLSQQISLLRRILEDEEGEHAYIRTIPKKGYLFCMDVEKRVGADQGSCEVPAPSKGSAGSLPWPGGWRGTLVAALVLTALLGSAVWRIHLPRASGPLPFCRSLPLTTCGDAAFPALSPDGARLAFVTGIPGSQCVWTQDLKGLNRTALLSAFPGRIQGITFGPGGNSLYVTCFLEQESRLLRVPCMGGDTETVMKSLDGPVSFSPDGARMLFRRSLPSDEVGLFIAKADGSDPRLLSVRRHPAGFGMEGLDWSPDGRLVTFPVSAPTSDDLIFNMAVIRVSDGQETMLQQPRFLWIGQAVWRRDGKGIYAVARTNGVAGNQVWYVPWPFSSGGVRQITRGHDHCSLALDRKGRCLVTTEVVKHAFFSRVPLGPDGPSAMAGSACLDVNSAGLGMACLPDGGLLVGSDGSGTPSLVRMEPDGSGRQPFLQDSHSDEQPSVARNAHQMAFASRRGGNLNIWTADLSGNGLRQLTRGPIAASPAISPDGNVVYFAAPLEDLWAIWGIWRVGLDGSAPVRVAHEAAANPVVSPDGKWLGFNLWNERDGNWQLAVLPTRGGDIIRLSTTLHESSPLAWTPDSKAIVFLDTSQSGVSNLFRQNLGHGATEPLTRFNDQLIFRFALSCDGKVAHCERGTRISNVVQLVPIK